MKRCPYCAEEIQDAAIKCRFCGSMLVDGRTGAPASAIPPSTVDDGALQYSHSGQRYLLGYGSDFYGIWDRQAPGAPVRRYPRTDDGWTRAWLDYSSWEPDNASVGLTPQPTPQGSSATVAFGGPAAAVARPTSGTNRKATWSLVLGVIFLFVFGIGEIAVLALGYQARKEIRASGGLQTGDGLALAGIILGWVGLAGWIVSLIYLASTGGFPS